MKRGQQWCLSHLGTYYLHNNTVRAAVGDQVTSCEVDGDVWCIASTAMVETGMPTVSLVVDQREHLAVMTLSVPSLKLLSSTKVEKPDVVWGNVVDVAVGAGPSVVVATAEKVWHWTLGQKWNSIAMELQCLLSIEACLSLPLRIVSISHQGVVQGHVLEATRCRQDMSHVHGWFLLPEQPGSPLLSLQLYQHGEAIDSMLLPPEVRHLNLMYRVHVLDQFIQPLWILSSRGDMLVVHPSRSIQRTDAQVIRVQGATRCRVMYKDDHPFESMLYFEAEENTYIQQVPLFPSNQTASKVQLQMTEAMRNEADRVRLEIERTRHRIAWKEYYAHHSSMHTASPTSTWGLFDLATVQEEEIDRAQFSSTVPPYTTEPGLWNPLHVSDTKAMRSVDAQRVTITCSVQNTRQEPLQQCSIVILPLGCSHLNSTSHVVSSLALQESATVSAHCIVGGDESVRAILCFEYQGTLMEYMLGEYVVPRLEVEEEPVYVHAAHFNISGIPFASLIDAIEATPGAVISRELKGQVYSVQLPTLDGTVHLEAKKHSPVSTLRIEADSKVVLGRIVPRIVRMLRNRGAIVTVDDSAAPLSLLSKSLLEACRREAAHASSWLASCPASSTLTSDVQIKDQMASYTSFVEEHRHIQRRTDTAFLRLQ